MAKTRWLVGLALAVSFTMPAWAVGPVALEFDVNYWRNDLTQSSANGGSRTDSADAPGLRGAGWFQNWGLQIGRNRSHVGGGPYIDYENLNVAYRFLNLSENFYLAVGAGAERFKFDTGSQTGSTTGARLSVDARATVIGLLNLYGELSYVPSLGDVDVGTLRFTDLTDRAYELGLTIKPLPFLRLKAGYRDQEVKGNGQSGGTNLGSAKLRSKGVVISAGVQF